MSIETLTERALWLADKIPAHGDYAAEAAHVLRMLAAENDKLLDGACDRLEVLEREHAESFERWHNERRKREKLVSEVVRCYQMLLSEPNTKDALFNAENILREALAEQKVGDGGTATDEAHRVA